MHILAGNQFCSSERADITVYRHQIPKFAGPALESMYGSLYSSLAVLQPAISANSDISTYVQWAPENSKQCPQAKAIFLFRQQGPRIRVVNEGMCLDRHVIETFCRHMLDKDPSIQSIEFHAIATRGAANASSLPFLQKILPQ